MLMLVRAARLGSAESSKTVYNVVETTSLLRWWRSSQLTPSRSFAGSTASAAGLFAKQAHSPGNTVHAFETLCTRHRSQTLVNRGKACQGRGFAAQALARTGQKLRPKFFACFTGNSETLLNLPCALQHPRLAATLQGSSQPWQPTCQALPQQQHQ